MNRKLLTLSILSLVMAVCVACNADATPEPTGSDVVGIEESVKPEPLAKEELQETREISSEELEIIFEDVYTQRAHQWPRNSSLNFMVSHELDAIKSSIPKGVTTPSDLKAIYTEWRIERAGGNQDHENTKESQTISFTFDEVYEAVYATGTVNIRSGPGTEYNKVGSLSWGDMVTRTGVGTGDYGSWSKVEFSDGTIAYISSSYLSTTKPVAQQQSQTQAPSSNKGTTNPSNTNSSGSNQSDTSTTQTPTTTQNSSDIKPAGTVITVNGKTYTSTGEAFHGTWTICTNEQGQRVAISRSGTLTPLLAENIDLSDGGASIADGMYHTEEGSEGFN